MTLTAVPDAGYILDSWSGSCSGNSSCDFVMLADTSVSAKFVRESVAGDLSIDDMGMHEVRHGEVFRYQPIIRGNATICRKDLGHDDVIVDSETGLITWDTSGLNFGRGFHIRIKCSNFSDAVYASMVVHVDKSGTSRLRIAGQDGVSPYIGVAGQAMTSGDTVVFPDGEYPVSVAHDESYENAYKRTSPTDGTAEQFSTIMAASPGGVVINGEARGNIPKQKNAFQFLETNYTAVVGFVIKNVRRESVNVGPGNYLLLDFIGAAGAGTDLNACVGFSEAANGECSKAGMRVNGGNPLFQNSYDWGQNRYGIMTRSTNRSITRRSFVRLDEHKGDQPYGGFSNYCDVAHLSQDNTVFDSLAIAAPHYKHTAGLEAYPATGCEDTTATLASEGTLAVNNQLSLSLADQEAGPAHTWDYIVSYDNRGTCAPQTTTKPTKNCARTLLQVEKETIVTNSFFGLSAPFDDNSDNHRGAFSSAVVRDDHVVLEDVHGEADIGTAPRYLPESLLYFRGRSDTFYGDAGYRGLTGTRRWPIGGEDIIAGHMRSYHNPAAIKVGGGTVEIDGNRGAVASGESMSEYFWGYLDNKVPPLVVRVKDKGLTNRVAWEHLSGSRRGDVTGWQVVCTSDNDSVLATLAVETLVYSDDSSCQSYGVKAMYVDGNSGVAYQEAPFVDESSPQSDFLIENYSAPDDAFQLSGLSTNASGITWHENTQEYLVARNGSREIFRYDENFNYLGSISISSINSDTEGISFIGGSEVMVVVESNYAHKLVIDSSTGSSINGSQSVSQAYRLLPPASSNKGLEGVAVRKAVDGQPARVYACQEGTGASSNAASTDMRIVYFDIPRPDPLSLLSYDHNLTVVEPFDAQQMLIDQVSDLAGMVYDEITGDLIVVSERSSKALQIHPDTGAVVSVLNLTGAPQYEGVTIGPDGELVFVSEGNWVRIYTRQ